MDLSVQKRYWLQNNIGLFNTKKQLKNYLKTSLKIKQKGSLFSGSLTWKYTLHSHQSCYASASESNFLFVCLPVFLKSCFSLYAPTSALVCKYVCKCTHVLCMYMCFCLCACVCVCVCVCIYTCVCVCVCTCVCACLHVLLCCKWSSKRLPLQSLIKHTHSVICYLIFVHDVKQSMLKGCQNIWKQTVICKTDVKL